MKNLENRLFHEYRLKFYLNGNHYLMFGNTRGETHPHTWEFTLNILVGRETFVEFNQYESAIEKLLAPYQNMVLNEVDPFDAIVPTLENQVEFFGIRIQELVKEIGGRLLSIEGSETPTRSYIINFNDAFDSFEMNAFTDDVRRSVIDAVLDDILEDMNN
ncbi:MAG: 6-carboxytetrahydropterin synthase [Lachnospiraceae bacterium]|jgi:6-pyruvoyltetrahydropterin/6-carboxytetrahydropterin synthase|nr:6-carboxytetrahydropterin synthase [Lachnospiraceae bacterium]MBO6298722.1 6-carboxytetrahydropterin synthase [Lachnospiraceae bacterium]MBP3294961.1 6-carboxytetrahydropterin synthase [Lachnospiraceae bacterium]MCR5127730.1 6-carboxytetrahydropterin synthase [Lachnospiraceae bacterium]